MPSLISLEKSLNRLEIKFARKAGVIAKQEAKPIIKALRGQFRKKKGGGYPGGPVRKITGRVRKSIQLRTKFQGALKRQGDFRAFAKLKAWTPIANVLFSPKSGKKYRKIILPTEGELGSMGDRILRRLEPTVTAEYTKIFGQALAGRRKNMYIVPPPGPITIKEG